MKIREENETDIHHITELHNQAFNSTIEGNIVENLRKNNNLTISLVCERNGKVVGHIAYSPIYNNKEIEGLGLAPVAILPHHQKQGIGSALIREGNGIALSKGYRKIFVLGDPGYYFRFGFKMAKEYNYYSTFDPDGNHYMVMGNGLERASKKIVVHYCKEFNE